MDGGLCLSLHKSLNMFPSRFSLVCMAAMAFVACNNETESPVRKDGFTKVLKTKEDSLYSDVMEGHDIGMAKMQKISKYHADVKDKLDSLSKLPASKVDKNYQQALTALDEDLNYADVAMHTWMVEFKTDSPALNTNERVQYLESEKRKVEKVKLAILSSLQRADSLFGKK